MEQLVLGPFIEAGVDEPRDSSNDRGSTRGMSRKVWRSRRMRRFLRELAKYGIVTKACEAAGIRHRRTAYRWYDRYEWFKEAWDAAIEVSTEMAEAELYRRGVLGYDKPVTYKGEITDTFKEYSDACLRLLLQARKPEIYRDRSEVDHKHEGNVEFIWDHQIPQGTDSQS